MYHRIEDTHITLWATVKADYGTDHDLTSLLSEKIVQNMDALLKDSSLDKGLDQGAVTEVVTDCFTSITKDETLELDWIESIENYTIEVEMKAELKEGWGKKIKNDFTIKF